MTGLRLRRRQLKCVGTILEPAGRPLIGYLGRRASILSGRQRNAVLTCVFTPPRSTALVVPLFPNFRAPLCTRFSMSLSYSVTHSAFVSKPSIGSHPLGSISPTETKVIDIHSTQVYRTTGLLGVTYRSSELNDPEVIGGPLS